MANIAKKSETQKCKQIKFVLDIIHDQHFFQPLKASRPR